MNTSPASRELRQERFPGVSIRVASSRLEREGAFRLAYQSYLRADLCGPSSLGMRFTPYQLLPSTDIIIAELRGLVISTLSLVRDGELGLPLESIYHEEVQKRREAGLRLAEVSCLADRRRDPSRYFALFMELARVMTQMADREGVDELLIAVHPRHAKLYCRAMAFTQIGDYRDYPTVNGNPAVALCLNIAACKKDRPSIWGRFRGADVADEVLQRQPISARDRQYFAHLLHQEELQNGIDADYATTPLQSSLISA